MTDVDDPCVVLPDCCHALRTEFCICIHTGNLSSLEIGARKFNDKLIIYLSWALLRIVCLSAANEGVSSPSQTGQQNVYNSATPSPYEPLDVNSQTPVSYQPLTPPTDGHYEYIHLDHPSPYEQLNTAAYEQLAT